MTSSSHSHPDGRPQPNSQTCFICGLGNPFGLKIRFYSVGTDTVEARVILSNPYQGYPGIAHGGIVATILDETMGRAILAKDPGRMMMTGTMELRYRQSVPLGEEILFRGRILKDRIRVAQASAEAILPDGTVAVEVSGMLVQIPPEKVAELNTPEIGWRVYEDHEFE